MATVGAIFVNSWNFQFNRVLDPAERIDLLELKYDIRLVRLIQGEVDCLEGDASAKVIYKRLSEVDPDWEGDRFLSSKFVPSKVLFLFWASLHESIPTRHMLQRRGVDIQSNLCLFCNTEVETMDHLFIRCGEVLKLWDYFLASMRVCWVMQRMFRSMMFSWRLERASDKVKMVWQLMSYAICWEVWNERNKRVHGGRPKSRYELEIAVKQWIYLWSSITEVFKHFSANQVMIQWEDILSL
ncbi:uncharacterized protein LOC113316671 [Papaver somniferum]|uniref:uncharacterized protein LOC113316671 n=1 Tax=Papaver somniferum TaxID=3469 RepID=UPI000E6F68D2|nr:uncharacterized protein LOC113316671 [Papaver somniferum]